MAQFVSATQFKSSKKFCASFFLYFFPQKFFIFCACITYSVAAAVNSRNSDYGYPYNHVPNPSESYIGPSSYATSFNAKEYPETGNFGALLNLKNPSISSTYTTYGPSGNNDFGSTTHINYPPSAQPSGSPNININWPSFSPHDSSKINYLASSHEPSFNGHPSAHEGSSSYEETLKAISQHVEITKPIAVPIYKKFPFAVNKKFPVAIPHPILVPVPAPYPGINTLFFSFHVRKYLISL